MGFGDAIWLVLVVLYAQKDVDPALGIQSLRAHLLSNSKNEKKIAELIDR
jgi:hypothetical protein